MSKFYNICEKYINNTIIEKKRYNLINNINVIISKIISTHKNKLKCFGIYDGPNVANFYIKNIIDKILKTNTQIDGIKYEYDSVDMTGQNKINFNYDDKYNPSKIIFILDIEDKKIYKQIYDVVKQYLIEAVKTMNIFIDINKNEDVNTNPLKYIDKYKIDNFIQDIIKHYDISKKNKSYAKINKDNVKYLYKISKDDYILKLEILKYFKPNLIIKNTNISKILTDRIIYEKNTDKLTKLNTIKLNTLIRILLENNHTNLYKLRCKIINNTKDPLSIDNRYIQKYYIDRNEKLIYYDDIEYEDIGNISNIINKFISTIDKGFGNNNEIIMDTTKRRLIKENVFKSDGRYYEQKYIKSQDVLKFKKIIRFYIELNTPILGYRYVYFDIHSDIFKMVFPTYDDYKRKKILTDNNVIKIEKNIYNQDLDIYNSLENVKIYNYNEVLNKYFRKLSKNSKFYTRSFKEIEKYGYLLIFKLMECMYNEDPNQPLEKNINTILYNFNMIVEGHFYINYDKTIEYNDIKNPNVPYINNYICDEDGYPISMFEISNCDKHISLFIAFLKNKLFFVNFREFTTITNILYKLISISENIKTISKGSTMQINNVQDIFNEIKVIFTGGKNHHMNEIEKILYG
ncbi:MAG: hypothetical protein ACOCP8_02365 [archaeon]